MANATSKDTPRLQCFSKREDGKWHEDAAFEEMLGSFAKEGSTLDAADESDGAKDSELSDKPDPKSTADKAVRDILYSVENLRKRPGSED